MAATRLDLKSRKAEKQRRRMSYQQTQLPSRQDYRCEKVGRERHLNRDAPFVGKGAERGAGRNGPPLPMVLGVVKDYG
jgi:hypothetical protein